MYKVIDASTGRLVAWIVARSQRSATIMANKHHYNRFNLILSYKE